MADDTRMALGIPRVVTTTTLGPVEVRTLSAIEFIMLTEQIVGIGKIIRTEAAADGDLYGAMQRILVKQPTSLVGLLSSATKRTADELGGLPLHEFLEVGLAFLDQHEKSIARFFELKRRWETLQAKTRPSQTSSTRSSPPAGPSPMSEPSATSSLSATDGSELFAPSTTG